MSALLDSLEGVTSDDRLEVCPPKREVIRILHVLRCSRGGCERPVAAVCDRRKRGLQVRPSAVIDRRYSAASTFENDSRHLSQFFRSELRS